MPHKLKTEVSLYIYESKYAKISFFEKKSVSFILWMCPNLKPFIFEDKQYIYMENEAVNEIMFMTGGKIQFVLPRYRNTPYINVKCGYYFGTIDIVGSLKAINSEMNCWYNNRAQFQRQFTVMSQANSEVLTLSLQQLHYMEKEFVDCFNDLFWKSETRLKNAWIIKL